MAYVPMYSNLGAIGEIVNPVRNIELIDPALATRATRVLNVPSAGYAQFQRTGLGDYRDALDALATFNFLFP